MGRGAGTSGGAPEAAALVESGSGAAMIKKFDKKDEESGMEGLGVRAWCAGVTAGLVLRGTRSGGEGMLRGQRC